MGKFSGLRKLCAPWLLLACVLLAVAGPFCWWGFQERRAAEPSAFLTQVEFSPGPVERFDGPRSLLWADTFDVPDEGAQPTRTR